MAIDFQPLMKTMKSKKVSWYHLAQNGIDNGTIDRLRHNRNITLNTLSKLCEILDCNPEEIIRRTPR